MHTHLPPLPLLSPYDHLSLGKTDFKSGVWVGVEYDEPLGKHAGKVGERQYFTARPKHGAFVRPLKVETGDFPEDDFDDLEEM